MRLYLLGVEVGNTSLDAGSDGRTENRERAISRVSGHVRELQVRSSSLAENITILQLEARTYRIREDGLRSSLRDN